MKSRTFQRAILQESGKQKQNQTQTQTFTNNLIENVFDQKHINLHTAKVHTSDSLVAFEKSQIIGELEKQVVIIFL